MLLPTKITPACQSTLRSLTTGSSDCAVNATRIQYRLASVFFLLLLNSLAAQANSALDQGKSSLSAVQSIAAISNQNPTAPTIDHCESLVTHLDPVVVTPIRKPPHMKLFRDPAFATKNRRITNSLAGQVFHPLENSAQSWNSDESLLLLQSYNEDNSSKFNLMDGSTYQSLGDLNISSAINNSVYWSQENSLSVLYVSDTEDSAGQLLRFDIATGTESLIKDFAPYCEQNGYPITGGNFRSPPLMMTYLVFSAAQNLENHWLSVIDIVLMKFIQCR